VDVLGIDSSETLSREEAAARLHAIADAVASNNEVEAEGTEFEIELGLGGADGRGPARAQPVASRHQAESGRKGAAGRPVASVSTRYTRPAEGSARRSSSVQCSVAVVT
jgi:hypothetical protein